METVEAVAEKIEGVEMGETVVPTEEVGKKEMMIKRVPKAMDAETIPKAMREEAVPDGRKKGLVALKKGMVWVEHQRVGCVQPKKGINCGVTAEILIREGI